MPGTRRIRPISADAAGPVRDWSRYRGNLARHLIAISRDLQARVIGSLRDERGYAGLRPSFGPILSRVWQQGRPLTALASELAISTQACSQLVSAAEAAGYLERRPNPEDGRSRVAVLTARGRGLVEHGVRIILESEAEYATRVGAGAYRQFTTSLAALYRGLGIPIHADAGLTARAGRSAGVLPLLAVRIQEQLMRAALARGHAGLKMSHGEVLPHIGPDGARVHEIARLQGVSRQAIHATARDLESLGYLRRRVDPRDRRGIVLALTERGAELIGDSVAAVDELERSFRAILGAVRFAQLERVARELYRSLRPDAPSTAPGAGAGEIERLAERLRRRLGRDGAERLAALLETGQGRGAP